MFELIFTDQQRRKKYSIKYHFNYFRVHIAEN